MTIIISAADAAALAAGQPVVIQQTVVIANTGSVNTSNTVVSTNTANTNTANTVVTSNANNVLANASIVIPARTITPLACPAGAPVLKRSNSNLTINGTVARLIGCNLTGLENTPIQGWSLTNYWGDSGFQGMPPAALIKSWGFNAVRIPLNAATVLGLNCVDGLGLKVIPADPAGNFMSVLDQAVLAYTQAGLCVILDQHWTAPKFTVPGQAHPMFLAPEGQGSFADMDTGIAFINTIATRYKLFPNVAIDLFNEPYLGSFGLGWPDVSAAQLNGGVCPIFANNSDGGADFKMTFNWNVAGFNQMVAAARVAGFTGLLLISDRQYAQDLSAWLKNLVTDPLNNFAASWHVYPTYNTVYGTPAYNLANFGAANSTSQAGVVGTCYQWAQQILAAGYPVVATEYGGQNKAGTVGEPFTSGALAFFDANGISSFAWGFMVAGLNENVLLSNTTGTPTPGFGQVVQAYAKAKAGL